MSQWNGGSRARVKGNEALHRIRTQPNRFHGACCRPVSALACSEDHYSLTTTTNFLYRVVFCLDKSKGKRNTQLAFFAAQRDVGSRAFSSYTGGQQKQQQEQSMDLLSLSMNNKGDILNKQISVQPVMNSACMRGCGICTSASQFGWL